MVTNSVKADDYDFLKLSQDAQIKKLLDEDERILLTCVLNKYNKRLKKQERIIMITTQAIYNINRQDFFAKISKIFSPGSQIKRKIQIKKLSAITVSELSSEFVIHVREEYDYRYSSPQYRDNILLMICKSYYQNVRMKPLAFFFKDDVNLIEYTTTEDDKKKQKCRIPTQNPELMNEDSLTIRFDEKDKQRKHVRDITETLYNKQHQMDKVSLDDFEILRVLGRGAFGKVMLVEKRDDKQIYALKSMHKEEIIDKNQIEHTKTERYVLEKSSCPFLVSLEYAFQTPDKIFFAMRFMRGGELFQHLRNSKRFDEKRAKFYAAEIILALEYLHNMGVVYRDLKPENILMDGEGHICLTDFGMAKLLAKGGKTNSFVGTPEYLAPEIIDGKGHSFEVDWWALGIFTYEMLIGLPPFYNREQNTQKMFQAIKEKDVNFGTKIKLSEEAKDFIQGLLKKDVKIRLGTGNAENIKAHPWFKDIDWYKLSQKKVDPVFKPKLSSDYDVGYFDDEFTSEEAFNSVLPDTNMLLVNKYQNEFNDFSYVPKNEQLQTE